VQDPQKMAMMRGQIDHLQKCKTGFTTKV